MKELDFHPISNIFPMLAEPQLAELAEDIKTNGLRQRICLHEGKILDGRNRYRACLLADVKPQTETFMGDSPTAYVVSLNLHRRQLTPSQVATVAVEALPWFEQEAKQRQAAAIKQRDEKGRASPLREKVPQVDSGKATEKAAELFHVNPRYVSDAKAIKAKAPDEFEAIKRGEKTITEVKRDLKRVEMVQKLENIGVKEAKELAGTFDVVVIDPPWPMEKIERDCRTNQVAFDYPTMQEDELSLLKIPAAADCHVWLWTTHRFVPMALRLLDVWHFRYVCTFVWHKPGGFQPIGLPQYNCEFALYARRGSPKFVDTKAFNACFNAERGNHSEKPEAFYEVLRRVTVGARVDMFNRRKIDGFTRWGKEAQ